MHSRRVVSSAVVLSLTAFAGCSAPRPPPPPAHTGWTLRYTERVGEGSATARDVRPDLGIVVLDGAARMMVRERGIEARVGDEVSLCRQGQCAPSEEISAMLAVGGVDDLPSFPNAREDEPTIDRIDEPLAITNVPTEGARFNSVVRSGAAVLRFTVTVRWADQPGERSIETVKRFFTAPLVRMGAARLVEEIRRTSGLPLHFEVRIQTLRADGSSGEGSVVYHAAEMGNPPAAL